MKVIGRTREKQRLSNAINSSNPELIVVYGRRRIGKTFLIREVLKDHIVFQITGLYKGSMKDQIKNFHNELSKKDKRLNKNSIPNDWSEVFAQLENYINKLTDKKKKVIFIDEFPWLATARSKFLMWFENFWNSYCTKRNDLVVVVCGSSASYMVKNIINNKGGLHNRLTFKIKLEPFNLNETKHFLKSKNITLENYDITQLYMIMGGIPYYLEKIKKGLSVAQNIDHLCFEDGGELANEFNEVFSSLFSDSGTHIKMIRTLSETKKGISRQNLLDKCNLKQTGFTTNILNELIETGFVNQFRPFGKKERNSLFRISDEYSLFYLKYIKAHKNQGAGTWNKLSSKQSFKSWSGYAFENLCLKHIGQIKKELGISGIYTISSSWSNENAQVDLIIDRDDNRINLCEMKFYNRPFTIDKKYHQNLTNKINKFKDATKTRKGVYLTFVTTFGIKQNEYSLNLVENEMTIDSLFMD